MTWVWAALSDPRCCFFVFFLWRRLAVFPLLFSLRATSATPWLSTEKETARWPSSTSLDYKFTDAWHGSALPLLHLFPLSLVWALPGIWQGSAVIWTKLSTSKVLQQLWDILSRRCGRASHEITARCLEPLVSGWTAFTRASLYI